MVLQNGNRITPRFHHLKELILLPPKLMEGIATPFLVNSKGEFGMFNSVFCDSLKTFLPKRAKCYIESCTLGDV